LDTDICQGVIYTKKKKKPSILGWENIYFSIGFGFQYSYKSISNKQMGYYIVPPTNFLQLNFLQ
jgi:hypothetical protein